MNAERLRELLDEVAGGRLSPAEAIARLGDLPYAELGFAKADTHRALRRGFSEVVYCPGKTPGQAAAIVKKLAASGETVLATRADDTTAKAILATVPGAEREERARAIVVNRPKSPRPDAGHVLVLAAGTSDAPVAEEARVTAEAMGAAVEHAYDVGVAGVHRLLDQRARLEKADAVAVVAGMEGALPSVVAGLVSVPIVACPTSIGYGASLGGLAALLAMLSSCAAGVTVVNIDNGFGAGYACASIARRRRQPTDH